jgi:FdhE protein
MNATRTPFETLAGADPTVAPLTRLYAVAFQAADEDWGLTTSLATKGDATRMALATGQPALHGQTLTVDSKRITNLTERLTDALSASSRETADDLRTALLGGRRAPPRINSLALVEATLALDRDRLAALADEAGIGHELLATIGHLLALPLLLAWGREAAPLLTGLTWKEGFCPLCGAWPTLAEMRGLDRETWLRCGRCAAGWKSDQGRCAFCDNRDFQTLGYLAAETDRESRRAVTCQVCHGYLKAVTTVGALSPQDIVIKDLSTLELDAAALDLGYTRPAVPGFPLQVEVHAAPRRAGLFGRW